jgi:hypothetical protein
MLFGVVPAAEGGGGGLIPDTTPDATTTLVSALSSHTPPLMEKATQPAVQEHTSQQTSVLTPFTVAIDGPWISNPWIIWAHGKGLTQWHRDGVPAWASQESSV